MTETPKPEARGARQKEALEARGGELFVAEVLELPPSLAIPSPRAADQAPSAAATSLSSCCRVVGVRVSSVLDSDQPVRPRSGPTSPSSSGETSTSSSSSDSGDSDEEVDERSTSLHDARAFLSPCQVPGLGFMRMPACQKGLSLLLNFVLCQRITEGRAEGVFHGIGESCQPCRPEASHKA